MSEQNQLEVVLSVECFTIAGTRDGHGYWTLVVTSRRYGQQEFERHVYEQLTTGELVDVLEAIHPET